MLPISWYLTISISALGLWRLRYIFHVFQVYFSVNSVASVESVPTQKLAKKGAEEELSSMETKASARLLSFFYQLSK